MVNSIKTKAVVVLSEWCPACIEYKLVLNKLISQNKVNVVFHLPEDQEVRGLEIKGIPTTFFLRYNSIVDRKVGYMDEHAFMAVYEGL